MDKQIKSLQHIFISKLVNRNEENKSSKFNFIPVDADENDSCIFASLKKMDVRKKEVVEKSTFCNWLCINAHEMNERR